MYLGTYSTKGMIEQVFERIGKLLSSAGGCLVALFMAIINYLGDLQLAFAAVFATIVFDMVWGLLAAIKQRRFILSCLLRETFLKISIYGTALFLILFIERSISESWFVATKTACAIAAACELWSIFANILIVRPKTPFIRLFRKYLAGEISRKLNIKEEDLFRDKDE